MQKPITSKSLFLAIDQGGHSSRAILFDREGRQVKIARCAVGEKRPHPGWVEQDPDEVVQSIRSSLERVLDGVDARQVAAAGMATQRSSLVCWDRETGMPLYPVISWQDRRAADWLDTLADESVRVHSLTGLFFSPHYGASKMRWCLENVKAVQEAYARGTLAMGPLASFLAYQLLQEKPVVTDPANASRTLLWNIKTGDWDAGLLQLFGIDLACLPVCVPTQYPYGNLIINEATIPLTVLNGDQSAAMYAYGPLQPDTVYINTGTGAFVSRPSGHYPLYGRRLLSGIIMQSDTESTYVLEGTVNGAGSAVDWVAAETGTDIDWELLPAWLEQKLDTPLFLNGISGLGAPYWVSDFETSFEGEGDARAKIVAVIESIIFLLEANLREMLNLASPPLQIQITGGLSRLDGLCQRLSDISGLPVYRPAEQEATARGTAYLVAGCPRHWPEQGFGQWFKPQDNREIHERFDRWEQAMLNRMRHTAVS